MSSNRRFGLGAFGELSRRRLRSVPRSASALRCFRSAAISEAEEGRVIDIEADSYRLKEAKEPARQHGFANAMRREPTVSEHALTATSATSVRG
jgi:hypothetical protein